MTFELMLTMSCNIMNIHSQSLTWNLKMMVSKRNLLFQGLIFRFHVNLWGCSDFNVTFHVNKLQIKHRCFFQLKLIHLLYNDKLPKARDKINQTTSGLWGLSSPDRLIAQSHGISNLDIARTIFINNKPTQLLSIDHSPPIYLLLKPHTFAKAHLHNTDFALQESYAVRVLILWNPRHRLVLFFLDPRPRGSTGKEGILKRFMFHCHDQEQTGKSKPSSTGKAWNIIQSTT